MADTTMRPKIITPRALAKALADAGIIPDARNVRRVTIVANDDDAFVDVQIECYGDERLLDLGRILGGGGG